MAFAITGDIDAARDAAQVAWIKAWQRLPTVREPTQHASGSSPTRTSAAGSTTGRFRSRTLFTSVKIAAFAPMPSARVNSTVTVKAGVFLNCRKANRTS